MTDINSITISSLDCCPRKNDYRTKIPHWFQPALLAFFGGLNNGYNMIVVAETLLQLRNQSILTSPTQEGIFVSSIFLGVIPTMPLGAYLADKFGRLHTVVIGESMVVIASLTQIFCNSAISLTLTRICVGMGMSLCVLLKPLYIAEMSSSKHRGKMLALFSLAFSLGVFVVALLGVGGSSTVNWRILLGVGALPSFVLVVAAKFYLSESPVWLEMVSRQWARNNNDVLDDEADETKSLTHDEDGIKSGSGSSSRGGETRATTFIELFNNRSNGVGETTLIAVLIGLLLELDGLWLLITYRNDIFNELTAAANTRFWILLFCGVILLVNVVPMILVDVVGRKTIIAAGIIGSLFAKITISILFAVNVKHWIPGFILIWVSFAQIMNNVGYTIISELYDARHRSTGMCFVFMIMLSTALFLSLIYKPVEVVIGNRGWFVVFIVMEIIVGVPLLWKLPETRGKEIE
jgi:MFS family permease